MSAYTVDYFIAKFEAIPEDMWCTHTVNNGRGQRCAYGHCKETPEEGTTEGDALARLANKTGTLVSQVNDGDDIRYQQATPKQRILAALADIKAKGAQ